MERMTSIDFQDLPIELLLYIFRLSFNITSLRQDRCRLSLVCCSWRDLVEESAYLWTEISAHDTISYRERALAKSKDLPIDIYYLESYGPSPQIPISSFIRQVAPQLSRSRSISIIYVPGLDDDLGFDDSAVFTLVELQSKSALRLESLILKAYSYQRQKGVAGGANVSQLPDTSAFPRLRRLEIDGFPYKLSPRGLGLHNVLSLNLVDVVGVSAEQLLDVLRNSPYLESLELGRSPVACPPHTALTPIHLPHLTTLHLIFMPISVSNFFLSTINAPNCSELSISSDFTQLPDPDVVKGSLFTSSTNHFAPILRTLFARGRGNYINITNKGGGDLEFYLGFHDQDCAYPPPHMIIRFEFNLNSVRQIEETVHWLGDCFQRNMPKISVRLFMDGIEDVRLIDILDFHVTITHFSLHVPSDSEATIPNPILTHMSQHTQSGWPLPNLEVFFYKAPEGNESQDEAMLDMLRHRYLSSSEEQDNARIRPRPIERVYLAIGAERDAYVRGEVRKMLPAVKICAVTQTDI